MVTTRGDVLWVDFGSPRGSEPAKRRPAIVVQDDWLNRSRIATAVVVPLTSNLALGDFPGNVVVPGIASGLEKDSVALVTQVGPVSREFLDPYPTARLPLHIMERVASGIRLVLGI